jgi:hypothetical protein
VPAKIGLDLALQSGDLAVQDGDHRDGGPDGDRVGSGQDRGLAQRLGPQHRGDVLGLARDVTAKWQAACCQGGDRQLSPDHVAWDIRGLPGRAELRTASNAKQRYARSVRRVVVEGGRLRTLAQAHGGVAVTQDPLPATADEQDTRPSPPIDEITATPSTDESAATPQFTFDRKTWTVVQRPVIASSVAAVVGGVTLAVGVAHISWVWLLALGAELALIGFFATQALMADLSVKVFWWRSSFIITLTLLAGMVIYHEQFDPARHAAPMYSLTVNGTEVNYIDLYGEPDPGSDQLIATGELKQNGLIGGRTYSFFECATIGTDRHQWLRYHRYGEAWWAPRAYLHTPFSAANPAIPRC